MKTIFFALVITLIVLQNVQAGECVMTITREACPGKETDSYAKCNGAKSCDVVTDVPTAQACAALSLDNCKNSRFDITQYKSVKAMFNHQVVDAFKDFCNQDSGTYKVSANYPFRSKTDCK